MERLLMLLAATRLATVVRVLERLEVALLLLTQFRRDAVVVVVVVVVVDGCCCLGVGEGKRRAAKRTM